MDNRDLLWPITVTTAFALGVAAGILFVRNRMEEKYRKIADDEIQSVKLAFAEGPPSDIASYKQRFAAAMKEEGNLIPKRNPASSKSPWQEAATFEQVLREAGYRPEEKSLPYIISPDEFGEVEDYNQVSLTYFSDGVLADENNEPIEDTDSLVGKDFQAHFGEYEQDAIYVRNERLRCDIEVLYDIRTYEEAREDAPQV